MIASHWGVKEEAGIHNWYLKPTHDYQILVIYMMQKTTSIHVGSVRYRQDQCFWMLARGSSLSVWNVELILQLVHDVWLYPHNRFCYNVHESIGHHTKQPKRPKTCLHIVLNNLLCLLDLLIFFIHSFYYSLPALANLYTAFLQIIVFKAIYRV